MSTRRRIGQFQVSSIGLGAMPFSMGGNVRPDTDQAIATVHAALDAGVTLIDTADIYAPSWDQVGHNEHLVAEALRTYSGSTEGVVVATKGGITRGPGETWGRNASTEYIREAVERSLTALETDCIDLYYWHRPDRWRLYADVIAAFGELRDEGLVKEVGISNANVEEIEIALRVLGEGNLAAVQNEFSPRFHHTSKPELDYCAEHGVAFLPWSPLGGTHGAAKEVGVKFPVIGRVASDRGVSPQQITLAWELSLGEHVIPIPGASRPESITDSAAAMHLELTVDEIDQISAEVF